MSFSKLSVKVAPKGFSEYISGKISWKTWAVIGIPVFVAGATGSYFIYRRYKHSKLNPVDSLVPKTPLEAALSFKNKGNKYFKAGQYDKAMELYEEGLTLCPEEAVLERSALHQNRAAAKEHLRMYDSAIGDCSSALDLQPRYLKALNRRAHLYEKLQNWEDCLLDVVACCIFEEFKDPNNIMLMDRVLKTLGQQKADQERANLSPSLPSSTFVRNYLSAYAWDPFTKPVSKKASALAPTLLNGDLNGASDHGEEPHEQPDSTTSTNQAAALLPGRFQEANELLIEALDCMSSGDYEKSMKLTKEAVDIFDMTLKENNGKWASEPVTLGDGDADDAATSENHIAVQDDDGDSGVAVSAGVKQTQLAHNQARLLYATYLSLIGQSKEAGELFRAVCADDSGADTVMRVNAMIKLASISMSADQNVATCLLTFQKAQAYCPDCPDIYLHRGQINLLAGQLDEALHDFDMAVKLKPEFSINQAQRLFTQYRQALSESNMDRAETRVDEFRRLAQKYPNCLETQSLYAQVLSDRNEFQLCDEIYDKVIALAPNSGPTYAQRGILHLRWRQDRDAAYKWFSRGAEVDPKCELIQELLGQLAVESGHLDTALVHFNQAIREAKTQHDLAHLIALRDSVTAQMNVCAKYNIPIEDVLATVKREQMLAFSQ